MTETSITAYAEAAALIAHVEGDPSRTEDELYRFGRAVESDERLRSTLADSRLPAERRAQIVEDVLGHVATAATVAIASMVVMVGRGSDLPAITTEMVRVAAAGAGAVVAEARSAVALSEEQISQLATALTAKLGREVTVRNIVDPSVMGGVVTQIGDEVIDGTVRTRLNQLREAF